MLKEQSEKVKKLYFQLNPRERKKVKKLTSARNKLRLELKDLKTRYIELLQSEKERTKLRSGREKKFIEAIEEEIKMMSEEKKKLEKEIEKLGRRI